MENHAKNNFFDGAGYIVKTYSVVFTITPKMIWIKAMGLTKINSYFS
jgi:hypothetical protein